jgi:hypothetical protein
MRQVDKALKTELSRGSPYTIFARLFFPAVSRVAMKFVPTQSSVDLARVGCALERYRLAHGNYPETLDALVPQYIEKLPHDIINGQPLKYRRDPPSPVSGAADGQFTLFSVGWNETDDGGVVGLREKTGTVDMEKGDWVWRYPAKRD